MSVCVCVSERYIICSLHKSCIGWQYEFCHVKAMHHILALVCSVLGGFYTVERLSHVNPVTWFQSRFIEGESGEKKFCFLIPVHCPIATDCRRSTVDVTAVKTVCDGDSWDFSMRSSHAVQPFIWQNIMSHYFFVDISSTLSRCKTWRATCLHIEHFFCHANNSVFEIKFYLRLLYLPFIC